MKRIFQILPICLLFISAAAAQPVIDQPIQITDQKTLSIVFPYSIKMVDRGTNSILTQKVKESPNILKVKAASSALKETNLTVLTADGLLYSFIVFYAPFLKASILDLSLAEKEEQGKLSGAYTESLNEREIKESCELLLQNRNEHSIKAARKQGFEVKLKELLVKKDCLLFRLDISNPDGFPLKLAFVKFYLKDKKAFKLNLKQETELIPVYTSAEDNTVTNGTTKKRIVVFNSFLIPPAKELVIEIQEEKGGRNLQLKLNHRQFIRRLSL